jgi:hypothetical protein
LAREQELGARYNRLTRQIIAFRLTHVVLAIVIGVIYMSHLKLDHLVYWRGFGFKTILLVALPVWPYVGSALFSWSLATRNRVRPWIFFFTLVASTACLGAFYSGLWGNELEAVYKVGVTFAQFLLYLFTGSWALDNFAEDE